MTIKYMVDTYTKAIEADKKLMVETGKIYELVELTSQNMWKAFWFMYQIGDIEGRTWDKFYSKCHALSPYDD